MTRARDRASGTFTGQQVQAKAVSTPAQVTVNSSTATTSATTYSVKIGGNGSATVTVNFDERNTDGATDTSICISTITLMEVLA